VIVVVVPAFNEAPNLLRLLPNVARALEGRAFHVVVVDDASTDRTRAVCLECTEAPISVITHEHNLGFGRAMSTGLEAALDKLPMDGRGTSVVVTMDGDNSHDPKAISELVASILEGRTDVTIAYRFAPGAVTLGVPRYRNWLSVGASLVLRAFFRLSGVQDNTSGFRPMSAAALRGALTPAPDGLLVEQGFAATFEFLYRLAKGGATFQEIPFALRYDQKAGKSKMGVLQTIYRYTLLIWRYAVGPALGVSNR